MSSKAKSLSIRRPNKVTSYLYIGNEIHSRNKNYLKSQNITHLLCVHEFANIPDEFVFLHIPLNDDGKSDIKSVFPVCLQYLNEALNEGGNLLVYCRSGVNRSASICISLLMNKEGMTLKQAWSLLKEKRTSICPHKSYFQQLREYDIELYGKNSIADHEVPKDVLETIKAFKEELS